MPILIQKKPIAPPIDCDAVDGRIRKGDSSVTEEEYRAVDKKDAAKRKDRISRATAAAMIGIEVRTLYNWHVRKFGPKRLTISQGRYRYSQAEVEAWVAQHGEGSHQPRGTKGSEHKPEAAFQP